MPTTTVIMSTPRGTSSRSLWKLIGLKGYVFLLRRILLMKTLAYVGIVNAIRVIIYYAVNFDGLFPIEACASFFGGAIFVTAILVNG